MSKYFDRLLSINESLNREINKNSIHMYNESSISGTNLDMALDEYRGQGLSDADCLVMAFGNYMRSDEKYANKSIDDVSLAEFAGWLMRSSDVEMVSEEDNDTIQVPKDSLTQEQKKAILKDNGVDGGVVDAMKDDKEIDAAMDATLNNAAIKKESGYDDDKIQKVLRIDDDDLDIHAFVKMFDDKDIEFTDDEQKAMTYVWQREIDHDIRELCDTFHYDPETVSVVEINQYDDDSNSWVALDPMNPGATTIP